MKFKPTMSEMTSRWDSYRGTVNTMDDPEVKLLKENIRKHNAGVRKVSREYGRVIGRLMRVRFMGRGPRASVARDHGLWARSFDSYLPLHLAVYYDVYLHEDTSAQHLLKKEIETGMKPGELAKLENLRKEIWKLEMAGMSRVRDNGPTWVR